MYKEINNNVVLNDTLQFKQILQLWTEFHISYLNKNEMLGINFILRLLSNIWKYNQLWQQTF
jgi:hypothetical protein